MNGASPRWRSILDQNSPVRQWDGEFLVFNPRNASTHLIGAAAYEVMSALIATRQALTLPELAAQLVGAEAADAAFHAELGQCLEQFEDLGLAESLPA